MLKRADENHRAFRQRDVLGKAVAVIEIRWNAKVHDSQQLVDCPGGARSAEDHTRLVVATNRVVNDSSGIFTQTGSLQPSARRLGMGVGVTGEYFFADVILNEGERPARGGVIGISDPVRPIRPVHHLVITNNRFTNPVQQRSAIGQGSPSLYPSRINQMSHTQQPIPV